MAITPLHPDQDMSESQLLLGCQEAPYFSRSFIENTLREWRHALIDPIRRTRYRRLQQVLEGWKGNRYAEDVCKFDRKVIVVPL
jgi:hypothetical protein